MYLIDKYDTLRSRRPYKPPFRHEAAVLILTKGDYGTRPEHFDPKLLGIFTSCEESFRNIFDSDQKA
jgi:putative two-component system response regulator